MPTSLGELLQQLAQLGDDQRGYGGQGTVDYRESS